MPHSIDTSSAMKGRPKTGSGLVILQFSPCTVLFGVLPSSLLPRIDDRSFDLKVLVVSVIFQISLVCSQSFNLIFCPGQSFYKIYFATFQTSSLPNINSRSVLLKIYFEFMLSENKTARNFESNHTIVKFVREHTIYVISRV